MGATYRQARRSTRPACEDDRDGGHGPLLFPDPPGQVRFARADLDQAASALAGLQKQAALAAHRSQVYGRGGGRLFRLLVALPPQVYGLICGREWFVEPGAAAAAASDDIFPP